MPLTPPIRSLATLSPYPHGSASPPRSSTPRFVRRLFTPHSVSSRYTRLTEWTNEGTKEPSEWVRWTRRDEKETRRAVEGGGNGLSSRCSSFPCRSPWLLSTFTSRKGSFMKVSIILGDRREWIIGCGPRVREMKGMWSERNVNETRLSSLSLASPRIPASARPSHPRLLLLSPPQPEASESNGVRRGWPEVGEVSREKRGCKWKSSQRFVLVSSPLTSFLLITTSRLVWAPSLVPYSGPFVTRRGDKEKMWRGKEVTTRNRRSLTGTTGSSPVSLALHLHIQDSFKSWDWWCTKGKGKVNRFHVTYSPRPLPTVPSSPRRLLSSSPRFLRIGGKEKRRISDERRRDDEGRDGPRVVHSCLRHFRSLTRPFPSPRRHSLTVRFSPRHSASSAPRVSDRIERYVREWREREVTRRPSKTRVTDRSRRWMGRLDTAYHLKGFCLDGMLLSLPSRFGTSGVGLSVFALSPPYLSEA